MGWFKTNSYFWTLDEKEELNEGDNDFKKDKEDEET